MTLLMNSTYITTWEQYSKLRSRTKSNYRSIFKRFERYLIEKGYTGELDFDKFYSDETGQFFDPLDKKFIDEYINFLVLERNTKDTLRSTITALRSLFSFLKSMKLIAFNPMKYYKNPFSNSNFRNISLTITEVNKLLKAALHMDPFIKQSYLLILLMITTGIRNSELRELKFNQIDFDRQIIYVNRGQKTTANSVQLSEKLTSELRIYMEHPYTLNRRQSKNKYVFVNTKDDKLSTTKVLNDWLKKISKAAEIKPISAHCLRYTTAYLLYIAGVHVRLIQRQLRHKRIETTLGYLGFVEFENLDL